MKKMKIRQHLTEPVESINVNGTQMQKHDEQPAKCPWGCMTISSV